MQNFYSSLALTGAVLLLLLSSCVKTPIAPDNPTPEPDTAISTFTGLLVSPDLYTSIIFYHNDTLSNGKIPRISENGTLSIRDGDVLRSTISCSRSIKDSNSLVLRFTYFFNLRAKGVINQYNQLDSLRSWSMLDFGFRINTPKNLTGFSFNIRSDTSKRLAVLDWSEYLGYEQISSTTTQGVTTISLSSAYTQSFGIRFAKIPLSFEVPAIVESFTLVIDKFTSSPPKRISGRISFKMISGDTPRQIVEVRDGRFDNVRFEYN